VISRVRLPLRFDAEALEADVERLAPDEWVPHFNTGIYEGDWSGVSLRSVGGKPTQLYPDPTADGDHADTETLGRCPAIAAALRQFECRLQVVRLLRLGPGASIGEHRDYRLGHEDGEVRFHVPITTNPGVEFVHEGELVPMEPGETWYLDFNQPHRVVNRGDGPRVHLVIDCYVNDWVDAQLEAGLAAAG
jgi:hypothetical protein